MTDLNQGWERTDAQIFWGEIAPCNHVVQIYENEEVFQNLLDNFVIGGIRGGDTVVVVATQPHIKSVNERIKLEGFDLFDLVLKEQFIPLDAQETLNKFMVSNWPDEGLFRHVIGNVLNKAKKHHRHNIRVFGEMVALLWAQGHHRATLELENLWNQLFESDDFLLLCAYPKSGFSDNVNESIHHICGTHSQLVAGYNRHSNDLFYKKLQST